MEVTVTRHAIERYISRSGRRVISENEVVGMLRAAAIRGRKVGRRAGDAWEMEYQGLYIITATNDEVITVITCLGSTKHRNWSRKKEINPRYRIRKAN